jgi:hypothetical protein
MLNENIPIQITILKTNEKKIFKSISAAAQYASLYFFSPKTKETLLSSFHAVLSRKNNIYRKIIKIEKI